MVREWIAKECEIKVKPASTVTIVTTATLASLFASGQVTVSGMAKDVTVTPPKKTVEQTNYMGRDSTGFQNATLTKKPFAGAKATMTLTLDSVNQILKYCTPTATDVSGGYKRYQIGYYNASLAQTEEVPMSLLINMSDSDEYVAILLNSATMDIGDRKSGGADGVWEYDVEFNCLPKDYYEEYKESY